MSKKARSSGGASKEREWRRLAAARRGNVSVPSSEVPASSAARGVVTDRLPGSPPSSGQPAPASTSTAASARGAAQVACGWCGQPVVVRARGPVPKWCSATCRHRAWEQDRAARSGRSAVTVVDRPVVTPPQDVLAWTAQLAVLVKQLRGAHTSTASGDLDQLEVALERALDATRDRQSQMSR